MRFKELLWANKVLENNLQPQHYQDFKQTQQKINQHGLEALSPKTGRQHLGALAPAGERERIHEGRTQQYEKPVRAFMAAMNTEQLGQTGRFISYTGIGRQHSPG